MTGAEVIAEARRWIGTPWHHQARLRDVGVDCGGLIVCAAQALGLPVTDHPAGYGRLPDGVALRAHIESQCTRLLQPELGAVVLMRWAVHPQHVGLVGTLPGGWSLIHAWAGVRAVVEHLMDAEWQGRIVQDDAGPCFYRLPGVTG
jgi:cell wall-associated NlpC family hydrolase